MDILSILQINALQELQPAGGEELSPSFHFGDAPQSASGEELRPFFGPLRALLPSILDKAFKGEL